MSKDRVAINYIIFKVFFDYDNNKNNNNGVTNNYKCGESTTDKLSAILVARLDAFASF